MGWTISARLIIITLFAGLLSFPSPGLYTSNLGTADRATVKQILEHHTMAVSVSRDGSWVLLRTVLWNTEKLSVIERGTARIVDEIESPNVHLALSWSVNRDKIAYLSADGNGDDFHPFLWKVGEHSAMPLNGPSTHTAFQSIRWSPDGTRLAYLVGNNNEATIWILAMREAGPAHPLIARVNPTSDFEWSPDGKSIAAVLRTTPLALEIFNVDSGTLATTITVGKGLTSEIRDMSWAPSGQTLAVAARIAGDFFELVKIDLPDHRVTSCVSGSSDTIAPHFASDSQTIIYSVSADSQIALYKTNCGGSTPTRISFSSGTTRFIRLLQKPDGSTSRVDSIAFLHSSLEEPPALYRISLNSENAELIYAPPDRSQLKSKPPEMVAIRSTSGAVIPTVFWPRSNPTFGSDVVVVDVHGGPHLQQYRRWELLPSLLTSVGVDVLSPNYRGSDGYGYRFEQVADVHAQTEDILAVCRYARSLHEGKSRVILMGTSYGSLLAASATVTDPKDISGLVLLSMISQNGVPSPLPRLNFPLFCFHGENDSQPPNRARTLIESFFGPNIFRRPENRWTVFPKEGHVFRLTSSWTEVYSSVLAMCFKISKDNAEGLDSTDALAPRAPPSRLKPAKE